MIMQATLDPRTEIRPSARAVRPCGIEEWTLTERTTRLWTAASVVLSLVGVVAFAGLYAVTHGGAGGFSMRGWQFLVAVLVTTALTLPLYVVHEWIHGLTMRRFGIRARYGWGQVAGLPGYLYCTAPGARFTRIRYLAIALAPFLLVSALGILAIAMLPWGGWLVLPLAFHFGGCVGDFWAVALILRRPRGTQIEDLESGLRFYLPTN